MPIPNNPSQQMFPFMQTGQQNQKMLPFMQGQTKPPQPISSALPFKKSEHQQLLKGVLASFQYSLFKHDPSPLIIVSDVFGDRIRGINLHYLTYRYMKSLLSNYCGKPDFSYRYIKFDKFVVNSFRTYKKIGIQNLNLLDCGIINTQLTKIRSFNPQELNVIRQEIEKQLHAQINPTAADIANTYQNEILTPQADKGFMPLQKDKQQDGRRTFKPQPLQNPNQPNPNNGLVPPLNQ